MSGIPVKFADDLFTNIVRNQVNELINLPQIQELSYTDDHETENLTYKIIDIVKHLVHGHIKDNYKVIIQVITYPKKLQDNILIMSQCLWNCGTDDVLSLEIENDTLRILVVIHGLVA